jgi:hypothetical protein
MKIMGLLYKFFFLYRRHKRHKINNMKILLFVYRSYRIPRPQNYTNYECSYVILRTKETSTNNRNKQSKTLP